MIWRRLVASNNPTARELADLLGVAIAALAEELVELGAAAPLKSKSARIARSRALESLTRDAHSLAVARDVLERRHLVF